MRPSWKPWLHTGFAWAPRPGTVVWSHQVDEPVAVYTGHGWAAQRTRNDYLTGPVRRFTLSTGVGRPIRAKFENLARRKRGRTVTRRRG